MSYFDIFPTGTVDMINRLKAENMKMRECITHHHACDCREAEFAQVKAENERLLTVFDTVNKANCIYCDTIHRAQAVLAEAILPTTTMTKADAINELLGILDDKKLVEMMK